MEKNEIEAALENSRKSFTDKMMRDATHTQEKDSSSVSDVSQNFIAIGTLFVMPLDPY